MRVGVGVRVRVRLATVDQLQRGLEGEHAEGGAEGAEAQPDGLELAIAVGEEGGLLQRLAALVGGVVVLVRQQSVGQQMLREESVC